MPDFRRILLIKPSSLGDIVHALPTAAALRRRFPTAALTWLVKREWAEVLDGNPHLDSVLGVDFSLQGWLAVSQAVRARRFDLVVDLQGLLRSALLAWISRAPVRVGFAEAREGSPRLYTHRVAANGIAGHAVDRYLLIAQRLGALVEGTGRLLFPLPHDADANARVGRLLWAEGVAPGTVLAAMNPTARWATKQWPSERFAAVGDQLQQQGVRVVIIGDMGSRPLAEMIGHHMRTKPIDLVGKTTVKELIALLRRARVLITNDSGPMHLAAALETPVVALFGPTDPRKTGPYGAGHVVLRSGVPCSPCLSRHCNNPTLLECLTTIRSDQVTEAALRLLHREDLCRSTTSY